MSNTIDRRIVQMDFDNAKFEKGVRTTLKSLTTLNKKVDETKSGKSLSPMANKAFSFEGIEKGIDSLNRKFSTLGVVWRTVVAKMTGAVMDKFHNAIEQIKIGGKQRAANIEQANFMLKGLAKSSKEVEKIEKNAMNAVEDTAYGYDSAAKAAAQFFASGMKGGKKMEGALRGIAGVAAMTGSSYDDIANIFTKIAGQGKVMASDWNSLAARGINGAAAMAKQLGITEKQVRDMTSKGQISFKMFAASMDNAFGQHAKKANETFDGSLANMKAAMNRIGAEFYMPYRKHMIDVFNAITPVLNSVKKSLSPVVALSDKFMGFLSKSVSGTLTNINKYLSVFASRMEVVTETFKKFGGFKILFSGIKDIIESIKSIIKPIVGAFVDIFGLDKKAENFWRAFEGGEKGLKETRKLIKSFKKDGKSIADITAGITKGLDFVKLVKKFKEFTSSIKFSDETLKNLTDTFGGLFAIIDIFKNIIVEVAKAILPAKSNTKSFSDVILMITGTIGRALITFDKWLKKIGAFKAIGKILSFVVGIVSKAFGVITSAFKLVLGLITPIISKIGSFVEGLKDLASYLGKKMHFDEIGNKIKKLVNKVKDLSKYLLNLGKKVLPKVSFKGAKKGLDDFTKSIGAFFKKIKLDGFISKAKDIFGKIGNFIKNTVKNIKNSGLFKDIIERIKSIDFKSIGNNILSILKSIGSGILILKDKFVDFLINIDAKDKLLAIKDVLVDFLKAMGKALGSFIKGTKGQKTSTGILPIFEELGTIAKSGTGGAISTLKAMGEALSEFFAGIDGEDIKNAVLGISSALIIFEEVKSMKQKAKENSEILRSVTDAIKGFSSGVGGVLEALKGTIESYKKVEEKTPPSKAFRTVAEGLLMIAGSMYIVSKIDENRLYSSVAIIMGVLIALTILVKVLEHDGSTVKKGGNNLKESLENMAKAGEASDAINKLKAATDAMIKMAAAIAIIAGAFVLMGNTKSLASSVWGMITVVAALGILAGGMVLLTSKVKSFDPEAFKGMAVGMAELGVAVLIMAGAMKVIGSMDSSAIDSAAGTMFTIVGVMSLFALAVSKGGGNGGFINAGLGMVILAGAVYILGQAVASLAEVPFEKATASIVGVIFIIGALTGAVVAISKNAEGLDKIGNLALALSAGLLMIAAACLVIDQVADPTSFITAGIALGILIAAVLGIGALVGHFESIGKGLAQVSIGMVAIAASSLVMAIALERLAGIPWKALWPGLIAIAGAMVVLAVASRLLGPVGLVGALALVAISASLLILAVGIAAIAALPIEGLSKKFAQIAEAIGVLAVRLGVLGIIGGAGLLVLGVGMLAAGLGMTLFTNGLTALIPLMSAFAMMPKQILESGLKNIQMVLEGLSGGVKALGIALVIYAAGAALAGLASMLLGEGLKKVGFAILIVAGGIAALAISIMLMAAAVSGSGAEVISAVRGIAASILGVIFSAISTLLAQIPIVGSSLAEKFSSWGDGIKDKVAGKKSEEAGNKIGEDIAKGASDSKDKVDSAIGGLIDPSKLKTKAEGAGKDSAGSLLGSFNGKLGEASGDFDITKMTGDLTGKAKKEGDDSAGGLLGSFNGKLGEASGDFDITQLTGDLTGKAQKEGGSSGTVLTGSFIKSANSGKGGKVNVKNLTGDLIGQSKSTGAKGGSALKKSYSSSMSKGNVGGDKLAKKAGEEASKSHALSKAADKNVKSYNSTIDKGHGASKAGKSLSDKGSKGAKDYSGWKSVGGYNVDGFIAGILSKLAQVYNAGHKIGSESKRGAKNAVDVNSPSRVFMEIGKYVSMGFAIGIEKYASLAYDAAYDMGEDVYGTTKGVLEHVADAIESDFDFDPTIRPVVDMSDVTASASAINGMMNSSFGLNVPARGINIAGNIAANLQNGGDSDLRSTVSKLASKLDGVTESMNSREMITNITIDGAGQDAELLANTLVDKIQLRMRSV